MFSEVIVRKCSVKKKNKITDLKDILKNIKMATPAFFIVNFQKDNSTDGAGCHQERFSPKGASF